VIKNHQVGPAFSANPADFLGLTGAHKECWIRPITAASDLAHHVRTRRDRQRTKLLQIGLRPSTEG
jgi:hypothetical protein